MIKKEKEAGVELSTLNVPLLVAKVYDYIYITRISNQEVKLNILSVSIPASYSK